VRRTGGNHFHKENEINNQIITQTFGDYPVEFTMDGYVNITQMCHAYTASTGTLKFPSHFLANQQTKEFIKEIEKKRYWKSSNGQARWLSTRHLGKSGNS